MSALLTGRGWARAVLVLVLTTLFTGCAHQTRFETIPSGADVYVDDEYVGETPVNVETTSGPIGHQRVEVRYADEAVRFDLMRESWSGTGILTALGAGIGSFVLGGVAVVGYLGLYATFVLSAVTGGLNDNSIALSALTAGMGLGLFMYFAGYGLMVTAPLVSLFVAGEVGRAPPERVVVDFERKELSSSPSELVVPLVGASSGFKPVSLKATDGE